jgi:hypothetical protein
MTTINIGDLVRYEARHFAPGRGMMRSVIYAKVVESIGTRFNLEGRNGARYVCVHPARLTKIDARRGK